MNYENKKNLDNEVLTVVLGVVLVVMFTYGSGLAIGEFNSNTINALQYAITNSLQPIVIGLFGPVIGFIFRVGFSNGWHGSTHNTFNHTSVYLLVCLGFAFFGSKVEKSYKLSKELAQTNS